ncbi:Detected protein of unknown function [Hibiscus syriacus]|uniref:PUB2-4-like N-terminal domain-containing protein n=1 Tax=Hibiscus syriacus TaxID=106335 RepID=A0A6A2XCA6_HIBSY|nr:Detected protein of unknown function [Hibiscus syriacus]
MERSSLETLLRKISSFSNLSSFEIINSEPVRKYYRRPEEMLNLLKAIILNAIFTSDEAFSKTFEEFGLFIEELQEQFESWQPLLSRVYLVLQVEALISKIKNSSLDIFKFLKSFNQHLPYELSLAFLEEILLEVVALEKLKENAEKADKTAEVECIDQLIALTRKKLSYTYLVPNYTIKALIANWCEVNNVKLPDLMKSSLNHPYPLLVHAKSVLPKDSNSFLNSRSNHSMSPKSQSTSQSGKSLITSSAVH